MSARVDRNYTRWLVARLLASVVMVASMPVGAHVSVTISTGNADDGHECD